MHLSWQGIPSPNDKHTILEYETTQQHFSHFTDSSSTTIKQKWLTLQNHLSSKHIIFDYYNSHIWWIKKVVFLSLWWSLSWCDVIVYFGWINTFSLNSIHAASACFQQNYNTRTISALRSPISLYNKIRSLITSICNSLHSISLCCCSLFAINHYILLQY